MPIYEYECTKCKTHVEILQKITDKLLTKCPKCKGRLEKQWSSTSFQLKGSGWYVTDYAGKKAGAGEEKKSGGVEEKKTETSDAAASTSNSSSDKGATKEDKGATKEKESSTVKKSSDAKDASSASSTSKRNNASSD
jgi:putative FmdB family regulatory protein